MCEYLVDIFGVQGQEEKRWWALEQGGEARKLG